MKPFEVLVQDDEESGGERQILRIVHYGKVLEEHHDCGEPEDNSFYRDWSWVPDSIEKAYALGVADAQRAQTEAASGSKPTPTGSNTSEGSNG